MWHHCAARASPVGPVHRRAADARRRAAGVVPGPTRSAPRSATGPRRGRLTWSIGTSPPPARTSCGSPTSPTWRTWSGFVYVAFVVDVFSRMDRRLAGRAARCAPTCPRRPGDGAVAARPRRAATSTGLVHHSDAGASTLSIRYTDRLADAGTDASIGTRRRRLRQRPGRVHDRPVQDRADPTRRPLARPRRRRARHPGMGRLVQQPRLHSARLQSHRPSTRRSTTVTTPAVDDLAPENRAPLNPGRFRSRVTRLLAH